MLHNYNLKGLREVGLGWIIVATKETLLGGSRFTDLYHLLSKIIRYEKAKAVRALSKAQMNKGPYYMEMAEMST